MSDASVPEWPQRLLIVGCGNMGGAMLAGWLRAGFDPERFVVVDPVKATGPAGVRIFRSLAELGKDGGELGQLGPDAFEAILLGVKPQVLDEMAAELNSWVGDRIVQPTVVLSLLAGVEIATLADRFPNAEGWVRIMPNLAAAIGKSPIGVVGSSGGSLLVNFQTKVLNLLGPLGTPEWFAHEGPMDAVTALGGSGPAFVYRFIDALAQGGTEIGLPADQALRLALAMVEGAAALAAASDHPPAELARRVASPGGTTEAGLKVLDEGQAITRLLAATLTAARDRSEEMAAAARAG